MGIQDSPVALRAYIQAYALLAEGALEPRLRELLAVFAAESTGCEQCLSAHSVVAIRAGATQGDLDRARRGEASDPRAAAALHWVQRLLEVHARIHTADPQATAGVAPAACRS